MAWENFTGAADGRRHRPCGARGRPAGASSRPTSRWRRRSGWTGWSGKSLALRRDTLDALGGWARFGDMLGEDQLLGKKLAGLGLRSHVCPTPVVDEAPRRTLPAWWERHTRWSTIRFRLVRPGAYLEPLLNPTVFAAAGAALAPPRRGVPALALSGLATVVFARACGAPWPATFPLQQLAFAAAWVRGATKRTVTWQGHRLRVGKRSRLRPE